MDEHRLPRHLRAPFPTLGHRAAAVSDHPLAAAAATDALARGGNAVDAAVAQSLMLGVTCPYYTGIGGGGFALVWMPGWPAPRWLDYRETAPGIAHPEVYADLPDSSCLYGPRAVGVPGAIAGLAELQRTLGRLSWAEVSSMAIEQAARGVEVDPNWHRVTLVKQRKLARYHEAARIFLRDGRAPFPSQVVRQTDLAATYQKLAEEGPEAFYQGEIADKLVDSLDGWITHKDLADYKPIWREPLSLSWDGGKLFTLSSPSAGGVQLCQTLGLMQRLGRCPTNGPEFYHWLSECMRISFRERADTIGDPGFDAPEVGPLLSHDWFQSWMRRLQPDSRINLAGPVMAYSTEGTASHAVATAERGVVVITESINHWYGSLVVAPGTGVLLNNIMDDFTTQPNRPDGFGLTPSRWNRVQAGKRPVSSSAPAMYFRRGVPRVVVGSAGGPRITTSVAQILLHCRWGNMNIQQAVNAPRAHHQWHPDRLEVEPQFPLLLRQELQRKGHQIFEGTCRSHAAALECHWSKEFFSAGADFRSAGGARAMD